MEIAGWTLFVLLLFTLIVGLAGGKVHFGVKGISMDTNGIVKLILEARQQKSISTAEEGTEPPDGKVTELPSVTILWVDDRTENNIVEREALSKLGARIECYTTNVVAQRVIQRVAPDLVISDIGRPGDEDGWQLLDAVRDIDKSLPFFFYTGRVTEVLEEEANSKSADGIFDDPGALLNAVEQYVRKG